MQDPQVFSVRGDAELIARAGHLFRSARTEFLCATRDLRTWLRPEAGDAVPQRLRAVRSPDFTVDKLLSPLALIDEDTRDHLRLVRGAGARVRISGAQLPQETIIIDRRVMILAGADGPGEREYTVTTSPNLVDGVRSLFRTIWDTAVDMDTYLRGEMPPLGPDARLVLEALGSGLTDESASRRLGVSLRTYRRRVADLMTALDAGSRFQAGLRAGERGLSR